MYFTRIFHFSPLSFNLTIILKKRHNWVLISTQKSLIVQIKKFKDQIEIFFKK